MSVLTPITFQIPHKLFQYNIILIFFLRWTLLTSFPAACWFLENPKTFITHEQKLLLQSENGKKEYIWWSQTQGLRKIKTNNF